MLMSRPSMISDDDKRKIIIGVLIAMFLAALDQTIVAPALPTIGASLGNLEYLPWIITAYLVTATAVTPLYGKLADVRGRRAILFSAIGIFMAGSLVCALSPSLLVLIVGRVLQGLGGGGLMALAQTVIGDLVPPRERGRYQGYIATVWVAASIAGPVFGGFFAEHLHWSVIFWINVPLGFFAIAMTSEPLRRLPSDVRCHQFDLQGAGLIIVATTALMLSLTWGGARFAWNSAVILGLLALTIATGLAFVFHLGRVAEPLLPLAVLRNSVVAAATLSVFFAMAAYIGISAYLPAFFQNALGRDPAEAGFWLVPMMIGTVTGATVTGRLMVKLDRYKFMGLVGLGVSAVAFFVLSFFATRPRLLLIEPLLVLAGLGVGALFPITTTCVQNAVDLEHLGVATGALSFLRQLGSAIGVSVLGAVCLHGAKPGGAASDPGSLESLAHLKHSFGWVFLTCAFLVCVALASFSLMRELPLQTNLQRSRTRHPVVAE